MEHSPPDIAVEPPDARLPPAAIDLLYLWLLTINDTK